MHVTPATLSERDLFLQQLRGETAYWHQKLEDLEQSKAILNEDVSKKQYLHYLATMYGWVKPFETFAFPILSTVLPDIAERRKTKLMERDLYALGCNAGEVACLPVCTLPVIKEPAQAMGMMYVIEGSTLGGAMIYKHIQKKLGIDTQNGAAYFQPYAHHAGGFWKSFLDTLVSFSTGQRKQQEVTEAATDTFRQIHDWFLHSSPVQIVAS